MQIHNKTIIKKPNSETKNETITLLTDFYSYSMHKKEALSCIVCHSSNIVRMPSRTRVTYCVILG